MSLLYTQPSKYYSYPFVSLMDVYEQNYILMKRLLPSMAALPDQTSIVVQNGLQLYVWVELREKYTTTLRLSYMFSKDSDHRAHLEPNLTVRIYHDAQVAEVMSAIVNGKPRKMRHSNTLESKWSLNRFLYKWLRYLLYKGYCL